MCSADRRCIITYNGEIYNYRSLRAELVKCGHRFQGESDTEVLVEALAHWGLSTTLSRINGIFAFALWETEERRLTLVRDPLGVKPLYWGLLEDRLVFGSELKALRAFPYWQPELDHAAVMDFLQCGYVPAPRSIYRNVRKLSPGCFLRWEGVDAPSERRYWDLIGCAEDAAANPLVVDTKAAVERLHAVLQEAVSAQLVSDVPLGAFLSGGVDSSTVVALMQSQSSRAVNTYTIGFHDGDYDEARAAHAVAQHLGTNHHELYVGHADLQALIPRLPDVYDEPFADASQLPMLMIAALARQSVTVVLSGDGGDELFAGYNRHLWVRRWWPLLERCPLSLRKKLAQILSQQAPRRWGVWGALLPSGRRLPQLGSKVKKFLLTLAQPDLASAYQQLLSHGQPSERLLQARTLRRTAGGSLGVLPEGDYTPLFRLQLADASGYLPDDVLTKVDRATMAYGLETRVPLLDLRVAALAWSMPDSLKIRGSSGKWLLRQVLHRYVPASLIERPKMGFSVPLHEWLRGPLRAWAESQLSPEAVARHELLRPAEVTALWRAYVGGETNGGQSLWHLLMLQTWLDRWM
jgi:asparagine synthase (glutamine-hydrolysing)